MPEFCTCGAQLPPDARFCHKCGKPQYDYPNVGEEEPVPPVVVAVPPPLPVLPPAAAEISFGNGTAVRAGFLAALLSVLLFFVIFQLPYRFLLLSLVFLAAGFLAVYLYKRRTGQTVSLRGGARMGWITGIFAFVIFTFQLTLSAVAASSEGGIADIMKKQMPADDEQARVLLQVIQDPSQLAIYILIGLMIFFVFLTVLPTLGGLLGAKLLAREQ